MADLITELSDDDIRTEWPAGTVVSEGDDDAGDTAADDDGSDEGGADSTDEADATDEADTSDAGGGDADTTDA